MGKQSWPHPIPAEEVPSMMASLDRGDLVSIGQVSFIADELAVWGVDPYGCDFIVSNTPDAERILACANRFHDPAEIHPAEFGH